MNRSLEGLESDDLLTLDQVRASLGKTCEGVSEQDLEVVREKAVAVLRHISDPDLRERSLNSVIKRQWQQQALSMESSREKLLIREVFERAKTLFAQLNGGQNDLEFYDDGFLENEVSLAEMKRQIIATVGAPADTPVVALLRTVEGRLLGIQEKFGSMPVGQTAYASSPKGVTKVTIAGVVRNGRLILKGAHGPTRAENVEIGPARLLEQAIFGICCQTEPQYNGAGRSATLRRYCQRGVPAQIEAEWIERAHHLFLSQNADHFPEYQMPASKLPPEIKALYQKVIRRVCALAAVK